MLMIIMVEVAVYLVLTLCYQLYKTHDILGSSLYRNGSSEKVNGK